MGRSRVLLAAAAGVAVALLAVLAYAGGVFGAGSPIPGSTKQLEITMSDGARLACSVTYPDDVSGGGTLPGGGHAGVILFHGLGSTHADMEPIGRVFAGDGYETLQCDARGTGASEGEFGLDGPHEVEDARDLVDWLSGQLGNDEIGAFGFSLGGGEIWNAAVAGVPFKAIVPAVAWTSLGPALAPDGILKTGLSDGGAPPRDKWDPALAQAFDDLSGGSVTPAVKAFEAVRSSRSKLHSLTVPTLIVQGRHDFTFDLDQALASYRLLKGPRYLYLGDLGHPPSTNPAAEQDAYLELAAKLFDEYLKPTPDRSSGPPAAVVLAHDPWDGTTTSYKTLPPTRSVTVNLPGTSTLSPGKAVARTARLTGGPLETFGDGSITVRYSGAKGWTHLAAAVLVKGQSTPVTVGAAPVTKASGLLRIPLLDEAVLLPRGQPLVVELGGTAPGGVFTQDVPKGAAITVGRVTLSLSILQRAVSR